MTYTQFEDELFVAIVSAADADPRGQVDVMDVANALSPDASEQWIYSAVKSYENAGLLYNVVRPIRPKAIGLMVTGEGRRYAETLG